MPEENHDPPIISYQSAPPRSNIQRTAGILMLIWSCVLLLASIPPTVLAVYSTAWVISAAVSERPWFFSSDVIGGLAGVLITAPGAYGLIRSGILLVRAARHFFNGETTRVDNMIDVTRLVEALAYLAGMWSLLLLILAGWLVAILSIPLFVGAGTLTYTRIVLRRVQRVQAEHESS